jgi:hypothetical protein
VELYDFAKEHLPRKVNVILWWNLSVPIHSGVPRGLFLRILKDAGFSEGDFFGGKKKKRKL